jgi:lysophospholipase L1-like esterase
MRIWLIARRVAYSLLVCGMILFLVSRGVKFLESRGWISLDTPDSSITYLVHPPYVLDGQWYVTEPLAQSTMIDSRFRAAKGDAWRMFVLGESFAMGTPYVVQDRDQPGEGGIASWLAADLQALYPSSPIEIINAAAGGQNSHRVRQIGEQVVRLDPDVILIATCNNEGVLPPGRVDEILHKTGAYRLLAKLTLPDVPREKRSYFTPQDPDVDAIRAAFAANLRALVEAAHQRRVDVLLCTMPVNLRYDRSDEANHLLRDTDSRYVDPVPNACTMRAAERSRNGDTAAAIEILRTCEPDLEGLRTLGMALFAEQRYAEAHARLSTYTELAPRNRCRPSLNQVIREQARATPWVHLVDLEAAAEAMSPGGIPGPELFLDYCHMNWAGYAAMADVVRKVLHDSGIMPPPQQAADRLPSRIELARKYGLPDVPHDPLNNPYR